MYSWRSFLDGVIEELGLPRHLKVSETGLEDLLFGRMLCGKVVVVRCVGCCAWRLGSCVKDAIVDNGHPSIKVETVLLAARALMDELNAEIAVEVSERG